MPKYRVLRNLDREALSAAVPHIFRGVCDLSRLRGEQFSLVVFSADATVPSTIVSGALAELPLDHSGQIVALGSNFTQEGFEALDRRNAVVFVLRGVFHWTDESLSKGA